ncbi:MAG: SDR family NAD(P)-dependent oxidoreductase, partial [Myxococcota bacterium]
MGDLDGKVAIVTGAARGLGRCEALQLASQGARLVINDLGSAGDGSGRDEEPARAVVDEIKQMGGEAVPHFGDVANWNDAEALIGTALDHFGGLNILVNNAGFIRDRMPWNMTEEDFDAVVRVHLKGHFCPMRFAMIHWREASKRRGAPIYGRLINTASESYLFGSVGQPNYAAAKAGIVAITMGAAQLLLKYGVTANVFIPRARTRMTSSGPLEAMFAKPEEGFDVFAPENATPLVGYLASPKAERISGYVFIIWNRQVKIVSGPGIDAAFENDERWDLDSLHTALGPHFEKLEPVKDGYALS